MIEVENVEWGWTSYRKTYFASKATGTPLYEAYFRADHDPMGWTTTRVRFFTRHPVKACRFICQSGRNPIEFQEKEILP